jgi:SAM-dependent methyltransferase
MHAGQDAEVGEVPSRRRVHDWLRNLIYPGLDLHTRNRALLCQFWKAGPRDVLDAGSGNGYFAWLAYQSGARVVAITNEPAQADKARDFLLGYKKADPARLKFELCDLYDLAREHRSFNEIICFETLEHVRRDDDVLREFYRVLRPGGVLHLCCPNSLHPRHQREVLDAEERGGHVRAGYTEDEYRRLLEPLGFTIERVMGIGSPLISWADAGLRMIRNRFGDIPALPLLVLTLPALWFARQNPKTSFLIYVQAVKSEATLNRATPPRIAPHTTG